MKINKRNFQNGLLVGLILFITSHASGLSNSIILTFVAFSYSLFVFAKRKASFDNSFIIFLCFLFVIIIQNFINIGKQIEPLRYVHLITLLITAYIAIKLVGFDFFRLFNKFVYVSVLISFFFYAWQQVAPASLHNIGLILNGSLGSILHTTRTSENILVYTIESEETFRNSGPMWEPGAFAAILTLAIYFELLINNFVFSKKVVVLVIGLITTFSTTGYILLILVLLFYFINTSRKRTFSTKAFLYVFIIPFFLASSLVAFLTSDILYKKIVQVYDSGNETIEDRQNFEQMGLDYKLSLGRFGSMILDMGSIATSPVFGRGYDDQYWKNQYAAFNFTNGLSNYVGRLGLIGLLWLIISVYKSGNIIQRHFNNKAKGKGLLIVLILIISFSEPVLFLPFFLLIQLFFLPYRPSLNYQVSAQ